MWTDLDQLIRYVRETLGLEVDPVHWNGESLPHFLQQHYVFHEVTLLNTRCLLMLDLDAAEQAPAVIRKHMRLVQQHVDDEIVYIRPQLTAYNRKRLVEQKIAFIVPGNQMYLPPIGIDFREYFRRLRAQPRTFSPSTQVLIIHLLLRGRHEALTPTEAAGRLGYSAMTMTRAFDELEAAELAEVSASGRERYLRLASTPRALWTRAQPYLRSPIKKRICIHARSLPFGKRAGLTALAELTMLAPPPRTTHALSHDEWKSLRMRDDVVEVPSQDPDALELEIWSHPPTLLSDSDLVDPLSLYLSLKETHDERIETSLEELLEHIKW